jgi:hypothetical protein
MDAEDVASAIEGFAAIARIAAKVSFGDDSRVEFKVKAVRSGSITIAFLLEAGGVAQTLLSALPAGPTSIPDVLQLIKGWLSLLKHLQGKPPSSVQKMINSAGVQIQNSSGEIKIYQPIVYNTFNHYDIGRHSERVARPLKRAADNLEVKVKRKTIANVNRKEIPAFKSVRKVEEALEQESTVLLKVVAPVFEGKAQWRFSRGKNTITATVLDADFLAKVQTGQESFRAGDILKVRLRSQQQRVGDEIKDYHFVEEVLSHELPAAEHQPKLM